MASSTTPRSQRPGTLLGWLSAVIFIVATAGPVAVAAPPASRLLQPNALRCGGQADPLDVIDAHPEFSWQLDAARPAMHGVAQSAYRIQVATTESDFASSRNVLWDTGIISSPAILGIRYAGPALEPQHRYAWRVQVWDEQNRPSGWSAVAHWVQAPDWRAPWIAAHPTGDDDDSERLPLFRKTFSVNQPIARALLYAAGLGQDEVRINGRMVGDDQLTPGWSDYRKTIYYDAYDVTSLLREGPNAIGVMLGNGMFRVARVPGRYTKFAGSFGEPRCTVQLHIEFANGTSADVLSDSTWKTAPGPITFSHEYGGEDFDARLEPKGWDLPSFDDASWRAAVVIAGPGGALRPEIAPPIRIMHVYTPVKITRPRPGILIYDLGQNFAGWPAISVSGLAGATVKLISGELLDQDGLVTQRSSGGPQWFSYTLRGTGVENWHPRFSYYGFRYVQIEGVSTEAREAGARILALRGESVHSSSPLAGSFTSSDELLNRIHTLIVHAIENNSVSVFTDCPHREKLGWLEETHLLAPSMLYDFDLSGLYAATARNIAGAQRSDGPKAGMVPEIAPQYVVFDPQYDVFNDSPEWGSAAVLDPWYVYKRTGDRGFLAEQYVVMRAYVAYLTTRVHDGILDYGLGDWYDIGPGEPGFSKLTTAGVTATAIYYQDLKVMERTAAVLGRKDESQEYAREAEQAPRSIPCAILRCGAAALRQGQPSGAGHAAGAGNCSGGRACGCAGCAGDGYSGTRQSHHLR